MAFRLDSKANGSMPHMLRGLFITSDDREKYRADVKIILKNRVDAETQCLNGRSFRNSPPVILKACPEKITDSVI